MAYATATASNLRVARANSLDRLWAYRTDLRAHLDKYKVYHSTLNELSQLSDRDLADLGLDRSSIRTVAKQAAYGN